MISYTEWGIFKLELWLTCRSHLGDRFSFSEWKTPASEEHENSRLKNRECPIWPISRSYPLLFIPQLVVYHTPFLQVKSIILTHLHPQYSRISGHPKFGPKVLAFSPAISIAIPISTYARSLVLKLALRLALGEWQWCHLVEAGIVSMHDGLTMVYARMISTCLGENWVPSSGAYWMVNAEEIRRMTKNAGSQTRWSLISPLKSSSLAGPRWVGKICVCGCGHSFLTEKTLVEGNTFREIETFPGMFFLRWECNYSTPGPTRNLQQMGGAQRLSLRIRAEAPLQGRCTWSQGPQWWAIPSSPRCRPYRRTPSPFQGKPWWVGNLILLP